MKGGSGMQIKAEYEKSRSEIAERGTREGDVYGR